MDQVIAELHVEIALLPSAVQKRSGYRPNHKHPLTGEYFLGHVTFQDALIDPGTTAKAHIRLFGNAAGSRFPADLRFVDHMGGANSRRERSDPRPGR